MRTGKDFGDIQVLDSKLFMYKASKDSIRNVLVEFFPIDVVEGRLKHTQMRNRA